MKSLSRPIVAVCSTLLRFACDIFTCHKGGEIFKLLRSRKNNKPCISFLNRHQKWLNCLHTRCFWMTGERNPLNGLLLFILIQSSTPSGKEYCSRNCLYWT